MVVGLVLIGTIGTVVNKWIAAKHGYDIDKDGERMTKIVEYDDRAAIARIEQLEKRVRVLERIATDEGARLASEIEQLRETRDDLSEALSSPTFRTEEKAQ